MGREFEIVRTGELPVPPEDYWHAITEGNGGWLWPMEFEPRVGGDGPFDGKVTAWDPPRRLVTRVDGDAGWFNQLEHEVEARDGGLHFRYVHSGVFEDDWGNQYDGAGQHTDFYLHTLGEYLRHFGRRPAVWFAADAPEGSFADFRARALGLDDGVTEGGTVTVDLPGEPGVTAVVDYRRPHFLGLRTPDAMYRFFGRDAFGGRVGVAAHLFAPGADAEKAELTWQPWLERAFS